jgi:hypothetical protein
LQSQISGKMVFQKGIFKSIVLITIPLVLALFYNQTANRHYHVLQNGQVVEHAHPYKSAKTPGTPFQSHQHSDFEYLVLAQLWVASTFLAVFLALSFLKASDPRPLRVVRKVFFIKNLGFLNHLLRAPPVLA